MDRIEIVIVIVFCSAGLIALSSIGRGAESYPTAKDITGDVLVLNNADEPEPWNAKPLGSDSVGVRAETKLVREGTASIRWKCTGKQREQFGFAIPPDKCDWSGYDQVQFWCHSKTHTAASVRSVVQDDKGEYRTALRINWTGWRLITVPKEMFGNDWSWGEVKDYAKGVHWSKIRNFGFEEHTYRNIGFYPLVDTDLTIDGVVLSKKILTGSLRNRIGPQTSPFIYVVHLKNLSDTPRKIHLTVLQQRGANPADEIGVEITSPVLDLDAGAESAVAVNIEVGKDQLDNPQKLRGLVVSIFATLEGHAIPQLEFRLPARRLYFDTLEPPHPWLYFGENKLEAIKELVKTDQRAAAMWQEVRKKADSALSGAVGQSRDRREALFPLVQLAFAYRMTGEKKYTDRAREYVELALKLKALNAENESTAPRATNLATGHNVMNLGIAYDWLYDVWSKTERQTLRKLIVEKGLTPHYEDCMLRYAWGHRYGSNWSAVVSGGVGVGALAVLGDEPDASLHVEFATERLERIAEAQGIDGGNTEGTSYWNYNMRYCDFFADALRTTTARAYNLFRLQPFYYKTCYYYLGTYMPEGQNVNFADAWHNTHYAGPNDSPALNPHFLRMASEFKDGYLQWKARDTKNGLFALLWYDPSVKPITKEKRPLAQLFRGPQYAVLRATNEGVDGAALGMRAGSNNEDHGHFDVLNFIVSGYGYQLAADYWPSKYSAPGYFGFTRHQNKRAATFGHNCILIDGESQIWGPGTEARFNEFFHSPAVDYLEADGSKIYPPKLLKKWKRHVLFVRPDYFVMWDEIVSPKPVEYQWRMMTWSENRTPPQTTEHGAVVTACAYVKRPDKAAQLKIAHAAWPVGHTTLVDRFTFDPKVDRTQNDKRQNFFLRTICNEKTDKWTLLTMLFPVDKTDSKGRGEFEPLHPKHILGAQISDSKHPDSPDTVLVNLGSGAVNAGDVHFAGRAALVTGTWSPKRYALILGTDLACGGVRLVGSDHPITVALALEGETWVGSIQAREETNVKLFTGRSKSVRLTVNDKQIEVKPSDGVAQVKVPPSRIDEFLELQGARIGEQIYP